MAEDSGTINLVHEAVKTAIANEMNDPDTANSSNNNNKLMEQIKNAYLAYYTKRNRAPSNVQSFVNYCKNKKNIKKANWSICESVMNEEAKKNPPNINNDDEKEDAAAQQLLFLYKQSPLKFRNTMMKMLGKHKEDIMKWGDKTDDGNNQITEEQMVQYLSIDNKMSPILVKVIFNMIYSAKSDIKKQIVKQKHATKTISRVEVVRFAQGVKKKRHVRQVTVQDANWVLDKIQSTHFAQIEKNDENKIDIDGFKKKFNPMGISDERIQVIFDEIDTNKSGNISVVQYRKWQSNKKANELLVTLNK